MWWRKTEVWPKRREVEQFPSQFPNHAQNAQTCMEARLNIWRANSCWAIADSMENSIYSKRNEPVQTHRSFRELKNFWIRKLRKLCRHFGLENSGTRVALEDRHLLYSGKLATVSATPRLLMSFWHFFDTLVKCVQNQSGRRQSIDIVLSS